MRLCGVVPVPCTTGGAWRLRLTLSGTVGIRLRRKDVETGWIAPFAAGARCFGEMLTIRAVPKTRSLRLLISPESQPCASRRERFPQFAGGIPDGSTISGILL
jgi:hypothetical protein